MITDRDDTQRELCQCRKGVGRIVDQMGRHSAEIGGERGQTPKLDGPGLCGVARGSRPHGLIQESGDKACGRRCRGYKTLRYRQNDSAGVRSEKTATYPTFFLSPGLRGQPSRPRLPHIPELMPRNFPKKHLKAPPRPPLLPKNHKNKHLVPVSAENGPIPLKIRMIPPENDSRAVS